MAGIIIGELLPLLAKQADKYSIIRSMTHGNNGHETAAYMVQTGRKPGRAAGLSRASAPWSRCSRATTPATSGLIPPYIVLTAAAGAVLRGRLPRRRATSPSPPAATRPQSRFVVEGIVAQGITDAAAAATAATCSTSSTRSEHALQGDPQLTALDESEEQAYDLILGDAGKVFDLSQEKDDLRDRYGRNTFGQSCLMARRLVEHGVPYVTINYKGWDTHKQHFQIMRRKLPEMDKGMATLLQDLSDRGLLDSTIVWWSGEFGRTPKVQWEAALERRTRPLGPGAFRPWSPAADSRAATSSGRPMPRANR